MDLKYPSRKPDEIDDILIKAWQPIYSGNTSDHTMLISRFARAYGAYIPVQQPFHVDDATADQVEQACASAPASAGGLDGWTPQG